MKSNILPLNKTNGLCECGCGQSAPIAKKNNSNLNHIKSEPVRFISGHNGFGINHQWKGGKTKSKGYVLIKRRTHPKVRKDGYILEHILVAEKALGKSLPIGANLHHINGIKDDNRNENLVICQDNAYHLLLHRRQRALISSGNANYRKCVYCKNYDDPSKLHIKSNDRQAWHNDCYNEYQKECRKKRKG